MLEFKVAVLHFKLSKEYRDDLLETDSWPWQKQLSNDIVNLRHQNCAFFVFLTEHFLFPLSQLYDDLSDMLFQTIPPLLGYFRCKGGGEVYANLLTAYFNIFLCWM